MTRVMVPTSIHYDPEWHDLTTGAQLLWYWLRCRRRPTKFSPARAAEQMGHPLSDVEAWAADLATSPKYGPELTRRRRRQTVTPEMREHVYARDGHTCRHCGATDDLSVDHIHPVSLGGGDNLENLQTLCRPCNSRKGNRVEVSHAH